MNAADLPRTSVLSLVAPDDFVGRTEEIDSILAHATKNDQNKALIIHAAPAAGLTELLRQCYDRLFAAQNAVIPIYFPFSGSVRTAENAARRFLQTFLLQTVAFRQTDANLLKIAPDVGELAELARDADLAWIDKLAAACQTDSPLQDARAFVRQAFSAPLRAAYHGVKIALLLDDFHHLENYAGDVNLLEELKDIYSRSTVPFVFAGRRRSVLSAVQSGNVALPEFQTLALDNLNDSAAGALTERLAKKNNVELGEQARDLIVRQFRASPALISALFATARAANQNLNDFQQVEKVYVSALLGGKIGKFYDSLFDEITTSAETQRKIVALLADETYDASVEAWRAHLDLTRNEFQRIIRKLHTQEIVRLNGSRVEATESEVLTDYLAARYRLEIVGERRALVVGTLLSEFIKRAPQTMTKFYRRKAAIGLCETMTAFSRQEIPVSLLDYSVYKEKYKGLPPAEILEDIERETEKIQLPQIIYAATAAAFYPALNQFSDQARTAVAFGFEIGGDASESEIVWLAAEINAKVEASRELAEFWCDRLEMVALSCDFENYRLWLVTPEGFAPDAAEALRVRGAFGASRRQVELLLQQLKAENLNGEKRKANEYEIIVPMGDDTEMIGAHAVEEIARRHSFEPKAIAQIKTALVEACINAAEHSLSPERKIYQKFTVEDDRIVITIANRGVKIPATKIAASQTPIGLDEARRGWGLKLIRNLMDEVKFERVDDGARISMIKYLKK